MLTELPDEPAESAPEPAPTPSPALHTTTERIKFFRRPYAFHLFNAKVNSYCSECLKQPELAGQLLTCTACQFVRYCGKDCQRTAWRLHKAECARLQRVFPNLPLSEVMFLSKLLDRRADIAASGDRLGFEAARPLSAWVLTQLDISCSSTGWWRTARRSRRTRRR